MSNANGIAGRIRQPEYTGENRCWPCTITNSAIAVVIATIAGWGAIATGASTAAGAGVAAGLLVVSAGSIWLRGYLIPGTPTLTKRYFPERVLRWFDKGPEPERDRDAADVDVEEALVSAGILEECENVEDLCLEDDFGAAWRGRIEDLRQQEVDRDLLRDFFPADPEEIELHSHDEAVVATVDGARVAQWESEAALLADAAAADLLAARHPEWDTFTFEAQVELVGGLRLFVERCPTCDGPVAFGEETVESCCRSIDVVAMTCEDCDSRLFEAEVTEEMYEAEGGAAAGA